MPHDFKADLVAARERLVKAEYQRLHGGGPGQRCFLRRPRTAAELDVIAAMLNGRR